MNLKGKKKQLIAAVLVCAMSMGTAASAMVSAAPAVYAKAERTASLDPYGAPSQEEIKKAFEEYRYQEILDADVTYQEKPVISSAKSLKAGSLSDETIQDGLDAINLVRMIVGLDEVTENPSFSAAAQHGCVLLAHMGKGLTHNPAQPSGVSDVFYDQAYTGTSHSNLHTEIGMKQAVLAKSIFSYMEDSGTSNFSSLGHRRWITSADVNQVGFGYAKSSNQFYSATYVIDGYRDKSVFSNDLAWPAQEMPLDLFGNTHAWSVNLGEDYDNPSKNKIAVTLTRKSDGKKWTFDKNSSNLAVDNRNYGQTKAIIFRPTDISYQDGDAFDVKITGLSGKANTLEYSVHFFKVLKGSITLDTAQYSMAPGDIYDIGVTIKSAKGNQWTPQDIASFVATGQLKVRDSRNGSIADLEQMSNGNFRVTGKREGTTYILYEIGGTHASIRIDVQKGVKKHGTSVRNTSYFVQ